jgi:hypothetical protein
MSNTALYQVEILTNYTREYWTFHTLVLAYGYVKSIKSDKSLKVIGITII